MHLRYRKYLITAAILVPLVAVMALDRSPWSGAQALAAEPVQGFAASFDFGQGQFTSAAQDLYTVPAGKRLIVEYAGLGCYLPPGQTAIVSFQTTLNGAIGLHNLTQAPLAPQSSLSFGSFTALSQQVRWYADPSTALQASVVRTDTTGIGGCTVHFSGRLVNIPKSPLRA